MNLDPLAENYISWSPYNYTKNNPIKFIDPDGRGVWIPDSEGNLIAEQGDNAQTLATHLNISESKADKMIVNQKLRETTGEESLLPTVIAAQKLKIDNNMTRSIKNSNARTTDELLAGDESTPLDKNDFYNCHDCVKATVSGEEINSNMDSKGAPSLADPIFQSTSAKEYKNSTTEVSSDKAVFGKTIITIGTSHSAVYYGKSKNGTVYVFSKNGHHVKPEVSKLSKITKIYNKNGNQKVRYYNSNK